MPSAMVGAYILLQSRKYVGMGSRWDYNKKVIEESHTPEPFLIEKGRLGTAIGKKPNQLLIALAGKEQPKCCL